jgi:hypothetical protein
LIIPNKWTSEIILSEWLAFWPKGQTNEKAQHSRPVKDKEKDLIKIIKYSTKVFTEPDSKRGRRKRGEHKVFAAALFHIIKSTKGLRIFDRFGFNLPKKARVSKPPERKIQDYEEWEFNMEHGNWAHTEWEAVLTDYVFPDELSYLLAGIDKTIK